MIGQGGIALQVRCQLAFMTGILRGSNQKNRMPVRGAWVIVEAQNTNQMAGKNPELKGITPPIVFPDTIKGSK